MATSNLETDCPCVGSMGLHQNNIGVQNDSNLARLGLAFSQLGNRSVIDVFRDMRDKYFGKPEIPSRLERKVSHDSDIFDDDGTVSNINALPVYCKLMILSLLDTCDVCAMSRVSSNWREVANDQILWRELLIRDMCTWGSMTHKSHPLLPQIWDQEISNNGTEVDFLRLLHEQTKAWNGNGNLESNGDIENENSEHDSASSVKSVKANREINFKALYIHSSFQRRQDDIDEPVSNLSIQGFIKSLWQGAAEDQGEVIMTGPGMDSPRTSLIFRSLMWGSEFLQTKGLLPGNRDGIGSGVQVMFKERVSFKLIAMYSGNSHVRERRFGMSRLLNSNVVEAVPIAAAAQEGSDHAVNAPSATGYEFVLYDTVRLYLAERNGQYKLVYVVDATLEQKWDDISCNKLELSAILKGTEFDPNVNEVLQVPANPEEAANVAINDDSNAPHPSVGRPGTGKRPLLVLSCIPNPETRRIACVQITAMLGLPAVTDRPWRVQDVSVSTMSGIEKGLEWLLRQP